MKLADLTEGWKDKVRGISVPVRVIDIGDIPEAQYQELADRAVDENHYDEYFLDYFDEAFGTSTAKWANTKETRILKSALQSGWRLKVLFGEDGSSELKAKIKELQDDGYRLSIYADNEPAEAIMIEE